MAAVRPLCCWAIPAVRSGYGEGRFRIDTIEPARPDQTIQQGSALTAVVAAEEDKILFPKTDGTKGSFGSVVIRLCQAIITVVAQRIPLVQGISERFAQTGFFDSVALFSTNQSCRDISSGLLGIAWLPAAQLQGGRVFPSIAYSSPIRFRASSAVAV
jgi:hypothetical protein